METLSANYSNFTGTGLASTVVTPFFGGGLDVVPCYYAASNDLSSYLSSMTKVW
jgi:hypothetical protein